MFIHGKLLKYGSGTIDSLTQHLLHRQLQLAVIPMYPVVIIICVHYKLGSSIGYGASEGRQRKCLPRFALNERQVSGPFLDISERITTTTGYARDTFGCEESRTA